MNVNQLESFFKGVDLPEEIELTKAINICDSKRFIDSHLAVLRTKTKTSSQFKLHFERLNALKRLIETGEIKEDYYTMDNILILDIETTGFLNNGGSIVEIGIVELNLETGEIVELYDSLCREDILTAKHRNAWIFENSDLTVDAVRNAPPFSIVKEEVQDILNLYPKGCTAFNNVFDFGFLENRGIVFPKKLPCPMKLATPICKLPNKNGYSGYKWPNVEEAFAHFFPDAEYTELHRGLDDAKHEAMIVKAEFDLGIFKVD